MLAAIALFLGVLWAGDGQCTDLGEELTISVLTIGPGDHPFYKFGHISIWVRDDRLHRNDVYNFGTFSFHSPTLIVDFFKGRLRYWLSVQPLDWTMARYRDENRSIEAQTLALTPAQRRTLADRLARNSLPDERYYKYDYYRDNCSTRVRDAIDDVIGGRLHAASRAPASMSLRAHTERLTADNVALQLGLDVAMGPFIDRPISEWQEMFLPEKVKESLRRVTVPTPNGDVPLVSAETVLLAAHREPLRSTPPRQALPMALAGAFLGSALLGLGRLGARCRPARIAFGALLSVVSLVLGLLGWVFVLLWVATDHEVAYRNENILQCAPWALAVCVAALGLAARRSGGERAVFALAALTLGSSALGLLLKVFPWFDQTNGHIIAFVFPMWAGTTVGSYFCWAGTQRTRMSTIVR